MLQNVNDIITETQVKKLKELEELEIFSFMNSVFREIIMENIKKKECESEIDTAFHLVRESDKVTFDFQGNKSQLIKMFVQGFIENTDFKNIVLNLSRLNFVYSESEIREIFKIS